MNLMLVELEKAGLLQLVLQSKFRQQNKLVIDLVFSNSRVCLYSD
jgi:hypothetical protein